MTSGWRKRQIQMPKFDIWERETLVDFAGECYVKLCEQDDRIQHLQCDLKTAIEAYRALSKEHGTLIDAPVLKSP